jgi:hypothetical protein
MTKTNITDNKSSNNNSSISLGQPLSPPPVPVLPQYTKTTNANLRPETIRDLNILNQLFEHDKILEQRALQEKRQPPLPNTGEEVSP